jgi:hypothetical protein
MRMLLCAVAVAAALSRMCLPAVALDSSQSTCPYDPPMTFTSWTNMSGQEFGAGQREYIFADGYICSDTDQKFQQFLNQNPPKAPNTIVVLNSGGGDVAAGLHMGEIIRQAKMWTQVGSQYPLMIGGNQNIPANVVPFIPWPAAPPFPGYCYSSCTFTFMGGVHRTIEYGSNYGVHRFEFTETVASPADQAQINSAALVQYVHEMGISPDYMAQMVKQGGNNVTNLSMKVLQQLKIITPRWHTKWRIAPLPDNSGFFLDGETTDFWGAHEIAVTCAPKPVPQTGTTQTSPGPTAATASQTGQAPPAAAPAPPAAAPPAAAPAPSPLVQIAFSLDPGARAKAQDVVGAVQTYVLELDDGWTTLSGPTIAKPAAVTGPANRLTAVINVSQNGITTLAGATYIGFAFMFDPAAKLPLRLLNFESTLDDAKLKAFAATCH